MEDIKEQVNNFFTEEQENNKHKLWALMLFNTELELGISAQPNKWVNTKNIFFNKGIDALDAYANIPNPASQLIDAKSKEQLIKRMEKMLVNFSDEKWLQETLYPSL